MKKLYYPTFFALLLTGCNNLEDAELTKRNSFIRFYEGANSYQAAEVIATSDGGYLITGTIKIEGNNPQEKMLIIKTDNFGVRQFDRVIDDGRCAGAVATSAGFVVVGDEVKYTPSSDVLSDLENTASRLLLLDDGLNVVEDLSYSSEIVNQNTGTTTHIDFRTTGITTDGENLITVGVHQRPGNQKVADITKIELGTLDTLWNQNFDYQDRDYVNTRSIYYENGRVLWGASISETVSTFTKSYLAIPLIEEGTTFINSNYFGQNLDQLSLKINDLKRSPLGYAAVGTYAKSDGTNANIFFIRVDANGYFIENSVRYFDFNPSNISIGSPDQSASEDVGSALTSTRDGGYVIAGSTVNLDGGNDIWLIKVDAFGEVIWNKTIGGRSSENVSSILETADGSLVICGTIADGNTGVGGLSSIFLIKTDQNGELND
jgi:hypothetical protein